MIRKLIQPITHKICKPQSSLYFTLTTDNYGQLRHHCAAAAIRSTDRRRQIRRLRGGEQQVLPWLRNGSSMPLSRMFHPSHDCNLHSFHCQAPCFLPHSNLRPPLQTQVLNSQSTHPHFRILHLDRPSAFSGLRNFDVNCRGFCRVADGCGSESEGDNVEGEIVESKAEPKEVEIVCKIVEELFALDRNMEAVLDGCGIILTHDLVVDVLERFKHARRPAFRFFCWAGQKPGFCHDSRTYNSMIAVLGRSRQFETLVTLLEEMGVKGLLTVETFHISIRAFAAGKERKKAVGTFELMKRYNFEVGVDTFNILLFNLGRAKLAKEGQLLFEKLKSNFTPNLQTYTILISNWCIVRNLLEAGKMWNEMVDKGFKPDIVAHNLMLEGLLKAQKRSDAIKLLEVMKAKGPSPNVQSYTILIKDLCKHKKMNEVVEYFEEMNESGCKPDIALYTCLITGYGNQKQMDKVYGLLMDMKEKGCPPDERMYSALIRLMANRKMPDDALKIYKKMIRSGIQPTNDTYSIMLKSCFRANDSDTARSVWEDMYRNGCSPNHISYTVFIGGLIRQGKSVEACEYLEEMIKKGMKAPQLDYHKFAADFSRAGKPDILEELAIRMKSSGKFEVSNMFAKWAEMMRNRVKRRNTVIMYK